MKKIKLTIFIYLFTFCFYNCDMCRNYNFYYDMQIDCEYNSHAIERWVFENIHMIEKTDNNYKTPQEVFDTGEGNCTEVSGIFLYLLKTYTGIEGLMQIVKVNELDKNHAIIKYIDEYGEQKFFDTVYFMNYTYTLIVEYNYNDALWYLEKY